MKKIMFIGGGNMAHAIIKGLILSNYDPACIYVIDYNKNKLDNFSKTYNINCLSKIDELINAVDIIFLAIKPQSYNEAAPQIKNHLKSRPLIISIMAGVTITKLKNTLGNNLTYIRAMPNITVTIQSGATALFADKSTSSDIKDVSSSIFSKVGITAWVNKETDLNIITALSGSGPAYFFHFMEIIRDAAIGMGLDPDIANDFTIQTALGAAKLAKTNQQDLSTLCSQVTSKGGTTEAALNAMHKNNVSDVIKNAMSAALNQANKLNEYSFITLPANTIIKML